MAGRAARLRVVLDASTLVSAALKPGSVPDQALLYIVSRSNRLIVSQAVEDEYREVLLRPKFDRFVAINRRLRVVQTALDAAERIEPVVEVRECSDPKDDKYLSLALAGKADIIVSSDQKHLLPMHPWRGISIVGPVDYLRLHRRS